MRIVMLGASGNAGRAIATLLGPSLGADDELVLAGRDPGRLAATLGKVATSARVDTSQVDLTDPGATRAAVAGAGLVVLTASRPDLAGTVARAALDAGADWFDTLLSGPTKLAALRALEPEIEAAGRCFVTDGGFHPGLPAVLVRWAAGQLDELESADVMAGLRIDWKADSLADSTIDEMFDELGSFDLMTWIDGERRRLKWSECPSVDFGPPIGRQLVVPMPLAEMADLPQRYPGLRRCGFYITGFGVAMDYVVLPVVTGMVRVRALRPAARRLTRWSLRRLAAVPPPHRLVVQLEATGRRAGAPATASISVGGQDSYHLTAAPAVVCLRQLLAGGVRRPGLHLQAQIVDPDAMLAGLAELGLEVSGFSR